MNDVLFERRKRQRRNQKQRPIALMAAMFTACVVTLIGVFSNVEPLAVLSRAFLSATLMGVLMSIGLGIIRTANNNV